MTMKQTIGLPPLAMPRLRVVPRIPLAVLLIVPTLLLYLLLLVGPLAILGVESFRPHIGGRIGGLSEGWTVENYSLLLRVQYAVYFRNTLLLSFVTCAIGMVLAYPVARCIARTRSLRTRRLWINLLVASLFLDTLVRCYALALFFGPTGVVLPVLRAYFGILGNNSILLQCQVVVGLLYLVIPISALNLVGPIENINPSLAEAAQTLGASYWKSALVTDVALSVPAIWSCFFITFTLCITSFIVPMLLGKGFVIFIANLIYSRFSESADYPGGAALSLLVLLLSMAIVYAVSRVAQLLSRRAA